MSLYYYSLFAELCFHPLCPRRLPDIAFFKKKDSLGVYKSITFFYYFSNNGFWFSFLKFVSSCFFFFFLISDRNVMFSSFIFILYFPTVETCKTTHFPLSAALAAVYIFHCKHYTVNWLWLWNQAKIWCYTVITFYA